MSVQKFQRLVCLTGMTEAWHLEPFIWLQSGLIPSHPGPARAAHSYANETHSSRATSSDSPVCLARLARRARLTAKCNFWAERAPLADLSLTRTKTLDAWLDPTQRDPWKLEPKTSSARLLCHGACSPYVCPPRATTDPCDPQPYSSHTTQGTLALFGQILQGSEYKGTYRDRCA